MGEPRRSESSSRTVRVLPQVARCWIGRDGGERSRPHFDKSQTQWPLCRSLIIAESRSRVKSDTREGLDYTPLSETQIVERLQGVYHRAPVENPPSLPRFTHD